MSEVEAVIATKMAEMVRELNKLNQHLYEISNTLKNINSKLNK